MQGNQVGFESSLQQHLEVEQRRAVLEALGSSISPDSTLGEIIDAAEALGWSEQMGELSLADLADTLLAPEGHPAPAAAPEGRPTAAAIQAAPHDEEDDDGLDDEDEDEDDGEDEDEDDDEDEGFALRVQEPAPAARKGRKPAAPSPKATKAAKAKKAPAKKAAPEPKKPTKKPAAKPGKKAEAVARSARPEPASSKKKAAGAKKGKRAKPVEIDIDVDDRMSLDQAAEFFLPVVEELGEATMQALEEHTGVSRRKLRFHVGQLVKHGYLERHGMGRGTYYTRC